MNGTHRIVREYLRSAYKLGVQDGMTTLEFENLAREEAERIRDERRESTASSLYGNGAR